MIQTWCLPPTCVLCGAQGKNIDLCHDCWQELPWLTHACVRCALPLPIQAPANIECGNCLRHALPFNKLLALFHYQPPIGRLITGLKFHQQLKYAHLIGELLTERLIKTYQTNQKIPDLLIPMPLHPIRLRERGFNQAVEIARPIIKKMGIKMDLTSCQRVRATIPQTTLPAAQRKNNVKNAFQINSILHNKHVAILDDVVTTGHTIIELSRMLKEVGVKYIDIWCCARTNLLGDCNASNSRIIG